MGKFIISERFEVDEDQCLPQFNSSTSNAYAAKDLLQMDQPLIALRTSLFPPPRIEDLDVFMKLALENGHLKLMNLEFATNTFWGGGGNGNKKNSDSTSSKSVVLFYHRPSGPPLMSSLNDTFKPWTDDQIITTLITPLIEILTELQYQNKIHRAIRPTNIFFDNPHRKESIVLGECLSVPYGYDQGVLFEPLTFAQADPIGRGISSISNDLFALGATISFLINGRNPCHSKSPQEIMEARIEAGTFETYCSSFKLSSKLIEPLRGLLKDEEAFRWNLKDLSNWVSTGNSPPNRTQSQAEKRSRRPFFFNNRNNIFTASLLAQEIRQNPSQALDLIGKTDLIMWVRNSLADPQKIHKFEDLNTVILKNATAPERLVGILQVLDPGSPFYWQGRSILGQGLGLSFAKAIYENDRIDSLAMLLMSPILSYYLRDSPIIENSLDETQDKAETPMEKFQIVKTLLISQNEIGGGPERCAYFLCPTLPCLSPYIKFFNCLKVTDVLMALDQIGSQSHRPEYPLDKHIIAFILTREKNIQQRLFGSLSTKSSRKRLVVMFKILAELQHQHRIPKLPGLCKWFMDLSEPVINSYKNLKWRDHLNKKLVDVTNSGNLLAMVRLLDNKKAVELDYVGLQEALGEVHYLENSVKGIVSTLSNPQHYGERLGQTNAMFFSLLLSFGFTAVYFIVKAIA